MKFIIQVSLSSLILSVCFASGTVTAPDGRVIDIDEISDMGVINSTSSEHERPSREEGFGGHDQSDRPRRPGHRPSGHRPSDRVGAREERKSNPFVTGDRSTSSTSENSSSSLANFDIESDHAGVRKIRKEIKIACARRNIGSLLQSLDDLDNIGSVGNAKALKRALESTLKEMIKEELRELSPAIRGMKSNDIDADLMDKYELALEAFNKHIVTEEINELSRLAILHKDLADERPARSGRQTSDQRRERTEITRKMDKVERDFKKVKNRLAGYIGGERDNVLDSSAGNNLEHIGEASLAFRFEDIERRIKQIRSSKVQDDFSKRRKVNTKISNAEERKWEATHGESQESKEYAKTVRADKKKLSELAQELDTKKKSVYTTCQKGQKTRCLNGLKQIPVWEKKFVTFKNELTNRINKNMKVGKQFAQWEEEGKVYIDRINGSETEERGAYDDDRYIIGFQGNQDARNDNDFGVNSNPFVTSFNSQGLNQNDTVGGVNPSFGYGQNGTQNNPYAFSNQTGFGLNGQNTNGPTNNGFNNSNNPFISGSNNGIGNNGFNNGAPNNGFNTGFNNGITNNGFNNGAINNGFNTGFNNGIANNGFNSGFNNGLTNNGFNNGLTNNGFNTGLTNNGFNTGFNNGLTNNGFNTGFNNGLTNNGFNTGFNNGFNNNNFYNNGVSGYGGFNNNVFNQSANPFVSNGFNTGLNNGFTNNGYNTGYTNTGLNNGFINNNGYNTGYSNNGFINNGLNTGYNNNGVINNGYNTGYGNNGFINNGFNTGYGNTGIINNSFGQNPFVSGGF